MLDSDTRHLVGAWNPSYGTDVMESHILCSATARNPRLLKRSLAALGVGCEGDLVKLAVRMANA